MFQTFLSKISWSQMCRFVSGLLVLFLWFVSIPFFFLSLFILWESARLRAACEWGRGRERKRESQAGSVPSVWSWTCGSIPWTVRSWCELKSRVRCLPDWALQAPLACLYLMTVPHCFGCCGFVVSLEIRKCESSNFVLFIPPKIILAIYDHRVVVFVLS